MVIQERRFLVEAYKLADLLIMVGSFAGVVWLQAHLTTEQSLGELLGMRLKVTNLLLLLGLVLAWHLILTAFGLYRSRRLSSRWTEARDVFKATSLGSLVMLCASSLFDIELINSWRWFVVAFWATSTATTLVFRLLLRSGLERIRQRGGNLRNVLIIGTNARARKFADKIRSRPELGYRLLGFVDEAWSGNEELRANGGGIVAGFDDLIDYLRDNVVDEVILALPVSSLYAQGERIVRLCEEQGLIVRFPSDLFNLGLARAKVDMFQDDPVMTLHGGGMGGWPALAKRMLDVAVSLVLLIALAPLFLVVAALIKSTSPGPVFLVQQRLGLNKRKFRLYKFRTGVAGIDGLPQLLNVLQGTMSLVGPRPLPAGDHEGLGEDWHRRRFSVRPGMTCLWQAFGRSEVASEEWMRLEMQYIDQWSFWLDLKILVLTVGVVLRGTGAA